MVSEVKENAVKEFQIWISYLLQNYSEKQINKNVSLEKFFPIPIFESFTNEDKINKLERNLTACH